jgi:hypothetical protein
MRCGLASRSIGTLCEGFCVIVTPKDFTCRLRSRSRADRAVARPRWETGIEAVDDAAGGSVCTDTVLGTTGSVKIAALAA